jgi:beta-glucosidase
LARNIEEIISQMTLEEKVSMLAGIDKWHTRSIPRLGIPSLRMTDGPHGARTVSDDDPTITLPATCFPTGSALGATWNTELINRVGAAIGDETRARGCAILLGPCINIHRSPLGGRNFESYSEDPHLAARMAVAYIDGVQSRNVGVSVKHYAMNNQEFERLTISVEADERTIREIYLPAFAAAVREGRPWTVMCSYNQINGTYASENAYFLADILKEEWGFDGLIVSDWGAVHSTIPAANAGLDLEMPGPARFFTDALVDAVRNGEVESVDIDDKVRRILGVIEKSGAFKKPLQVSGDIPDSPEQSRLAREAAQEAMVLLKNEGDILPLDRGKIKSIAVIGPNAGEARVQGGGSAAVNPYYAVTPLEGIRHKCGDAVEIRHETGCRNNRLTLLMSPEFLRPSEDTEGKGLTGEYFNNPDIAGEPALKKVDEKFRLMLGGDSALMIPGIDTEEGNFSIRWSGKFIAPCSGVYRFGLLLDGMGRIFIDDELVVEKVREDADAQIISIGEENVGECKLEADKSYGIRIEYISQPDFPGWIPRHIRLGCTPPLPDDAMTRAVDIASGADVAIVFVGLNEEHETEGRDRPDMELPGAQVELIKSVAEVNDNTIVVLNNGSPVAMTGWIDRVAAVVEAWFPGQECGNAIADMLFGDVNPSGKLPMTFPKRLEDNPAYRHYPGKNGKVEYAEGIFVGYRHYDTGNIEPLFPFGHGLSYTTFRYDNLQVPPEMKADEPFRITVDVTNTGKRAGKEVVQLYVHDVVSSLARPLKELKGFQKVALEKGETKSLAFNISLEDLSFYDPEKKRWIAEAGEFEVMVGSSSRDIRQRACFMLTN